MTIAQAIAKLRRKWPTSGISINPQFWEHEPGILTVVWSVWIAGEQKLHQSPTLEGAIDLAIRPEGYPEHSASIVEQAAEAIA